MVILDFVFPQSCLECRAPGGYICSSCLEKVQPTSEICPECNIFSFRGKTHRSCRRPQGLDGAFSVWRYKRVVRKAILALKYRFALKVAKELAKISVSELKKRPLHLKKPILIPIPLHSRRKRWRGFNQTEEIGRLIAEGMGWDFNSELLKRKVSSTPQVELKGKERKKNIKGVFTLNPKYNIQNTKYPVLLFDDVWTTGSTIKEAAKVLKQNGIKKLWALTLTRSNRRF